MPELPEVETVRAGLVPAMVGRAIERAEVRREGLRRPFPERMVERLEGARVLGLRRRSKYILADLSTGETLLIHLGMSGRMTVSGAGLARFVHDHPPRQAHDHVVIEMEGGARVTFNDARRFGSMDLTATCEAGAHPLLAGLGPEPLEDAFDGARLAGAFTGRRTPVKAALLDQRIVAGLGNIYVCEALHRAGISPRRRAGRIARARIDRLVPIIKDVLTEAIAAGGSSLRDHRRADGAMGYFQHGFSAYGREGLPCGMPGCGGTIARIVQSGRSTFHCPACQR